MNENQWHLLGEVIELKKKNLHHIEIQGIVLALVFKEGKFTAVSGECNHEKGHLGKGRLEGDYIVCPWHGWHFHRETGHGHPPFESACLPRYALKEEKGKLWVSLIPLNIRAHADHPPHPLARELKREKGAIRVLGISTTAMDPLRPRFSTSEHLLEHALQYVTKEMGLETKWLKIRDIKFNACGGFYSIDEKACTWPCTFTQMDPEDQLTELYERLVFWADVVLIAVPIRWGSANSLYYKMIERLNCIQNHTVLTKKSLIKDKVAGFIITGGQDGVQAVAGQMLTFFSELGFTFPPVSFIGHSRGWAAEDMENNAEFVKQSIILKQDAISLAIRAVHLVQTLISVKEDASDVH